MTQTDFELLATVVGFYKYMYFISLSGSTIVSNVHRELSIFLSHTEHYIKFIFRNRAIIHLLHNNI